MKKSIEQQFSCKISSASVDFIKSTCEVTNDFVWLSSKCRCNRYTLRGVPARLVDIIIDESKESRNERDKIVLEISEKAGRYDAAKRDRLSIRFRQGHQVTDLEECLISLAFLENALRIDIVSSSGEIRWTRQYKQLRNNLTGYNPQSIVIWHWTRYYKFIPHEIADRVAQEWVLSEFAIHGQEWTLAEANRSASRALYKSARNEGWRKLTLRERLKLGMDADAAQWQRVEHIDSFRQNPTGCGEYTLRIANRHTQS